MRSLQGHFLVASPHLVDSNFLRSVVLMVQHDSDGAFGLVLNRVLDKTVSDVWELVASEACDCALPIHVGGPVPRPLVALHGNQEYAEQEIVAGVFFTAHKDLLQQLVHDTPEQIRMFSGYSGWSGGQLEGEIKAGGWLSARATADEVFGDIDKVWRKMTRRIHLEILGDTLRPRHVPDDPSWN